MTAKKWHPGPLLLLILSSPVLSFPFIGDDFNFLHRARHFTLAQLLPDPRISLYRPLAREGYFAALAAWGGNHPLVGHLANLAVALACVALVTLIATRLMDIHTGVLAGLLLASLGPLPLLVGWTPGSQDLAAMLLVLAAILLLMKGKMFWAAVAAGAALLAKETTLFALPGLALWSGAVDGDWKEARRRGWPFLLLGVLWLAGNHARSIVSGPGGYTGLDNPQFLPYLGHELAALVNLPLGAPPWPARLNLAALLALALVGVTMARGELPGDARQKRPAWASGVAFGVLFGLVPAVLTAWTVKHWVPYYACFPAIGASVLIASAVVRLPKPYPGVVLMLFLVLGVWCRGTVREALLIPTEENFARLSTRLRNVDRSLHKLHPSFPNGSRLYFAINVPLSSGIQSHMTSLQAPQTWYWNDSIQSAALTDYTPGAGPEYMFWITGEGDVFEVMLPTLTPRSAGRAPDYGDYQSTIRVYAYALSASGHTDQAVDVLLRMQEADSLSWSFDRRLAATLLYESGRDGDAAKLCLGLRPLPRSDARNAVAAVMMLETPKLPLDVGAFKAYGIPASDVESYRYLMFTMSDRVRLRVTRRMAERILALAPGDPEARQMISAIEQVPHWDSPILPVEPGGD